MEALDFTHLKKQASFFLKDRVKAARLAFTNVTPAQLMTEEATSSDDWGPETKLMAAISDASYKMDDYGKIMQVIHQRLDSSEKRYWRQLDKTLALIEYLLTHGPERIVTELRSDWDAIEELTQFVFVDERGVDHGHSVQRKASRILELLSERNILQAERERAQKISRGILGFGGTSTDSRIEGFGNFTTSEGQYKDAHARKVEETSFFKDSDSDWQPFEKSKPHDENTNYTKSGTIPNNCLDDNKEGNAIRTLLPPPPPPKSIVSTRIPDLIDL